MDRDRIGKYQILGELGRGTMGEVYKALDPILHRYVALKTLSVRISPEDDALERFQREARAAAGLNHPNIVTIHDFGEDQGRLYMAMELLEGTDLRDAIDNDTLRSLDQKLDILDAVLNGLDYAHARGVIHRDIKPANIHLGPDGHVKIMDFGLARVNTSEMTQDGIVVGTPNYMSPEQALGDRVDARSDVFSTGAVLYELLTGHKPFEADSTPSVLFQVVHREPPPVRRWAPDVPEAVIALVDRALVKDKDRRLGSATEMRAALAAARQGLAAAAPLRPFDSAAQPRPSASSPSLSRPPSLSSPSLSRPPSIARRVGTARRAGGRRGLATLLIAVGAAALLLAAGAYVLLRERVPPPPEPAPARDDAQVGELTRALVATQVQLARRELENKNWAAAAEQAEGALRLAPGHPEATRGLEEARARLRELDGAISATREKLAAGDTDGASAELSHVLELDPRHPAAAELSARLNDTFRSQADAAAASMRTARDEARAAGAQGGRDFAAADATAQRAQSLAAGTEFADAARTFLEARDAFDRSRRAARAAAAALAPLPTGSRTDARKADGPGPAPTAAPARPAPPPPAGANAPALEKDAPAEPSVRAVTPGPYVPGRRFAAGETTVTTPSAGTIEGFETEDVRTRRPPRFAGRMEFEVVPPEVRPGEPFVVRVHLVNEGNDAVRVRGVELATIENGLRSPADAKPMLREVAARSRALVAEYSGTWSATGPWTLEAVIAADDDERVRSRLSSH